MAEPREAPADLFIGDVPSESVGLQLCNKLALKGFCVVAPFVDQGILDRAVAEVESFDAVGRWTKVNTIIQEGLFGAEGSSQIAELTPPTCEDDERIPKDGEALVQLDYTMTQFGFMVEPYLDQLDIDVSHRTAGLVHLSGEPDELPAPLTEKDCAKWHAQFLRHRLMVCIFLGPTLGSLELAPYDTECAEAHEVQVYPGTVVVLRPDLMSHTFCSPGLSLAMSTFFLQGHLQRCVPGAQPMIPPARLLDEWTLERLKQIKGEMRTDSVWSPQLPRDWQVAMNHLFHKGQMISVVGAACRTPMCYDPDAFSKAQNFATDCVTAVPMTRWDHGKVYDPDPNTCRLGKVYCKHASFMEGVELFDCKLFNMSPQEARAIDPHQRQILEVGYSALASAGFKKTSLINKFCGLYLGHGNAEWGMTDKPREQGAFAATGTALSIAAGRLSFSLGLKGPSMTVDTEASSGATAVYLGAESVQTKADNSQNELSLSMGLRILLCPVWWPALCSSGWLSRAGRCLTFDGSADGYVYSDGAAAVTMRPFVEADADGVSVGTIAGAMMRNNGRGATLTAPHGPAQQETMIEGIRNALISPFDIEAVETHGAGHDLSDAIEVGSVLRVHRTEDNQEPISLMAYRTSVGNGVESGGIAGFLKTMMSFWSGAMPPNLHLRQLNPHMDFGEPPCAFVSECCSYRMQSMFAGLMSQGFGGSNVYIVNWGHIGDERLPKQLPRPRGLVSFWPGGGGELPSSQLPESGYAILGSWSGWQETVPMEAESDSVFGYTVVLGVNRWESFQILLDGDESKLLHPGVSKASKDFPVEGPPEDAEAFRHCTWLIEGRGEPWRSVDWSDEDGTPCEKITWMPTPDTGRPGDQYRVRLRVRGKWRTVDWEKLPQALDDGQSPADALLDTGKYYVTGPLNDWNFEELQLQSQPGTPGLFACVVELLLPDGEFLIVRDQDWSQAIYPSKHRPTCSSSFEVLGPDDDHGGMLFCLEGIVGERFRVEFQRTVGLDYDLKKVEWRRLNF